GDGHGEVVTTGLHPVDASIVAHREVEAVDVALQVVGDLVLGRVVTGRSREREPRQRRVLGGREQAQRVPTGSPAVTGRWAGVQHEGFEVTAAELVRGGQARLAAADDGDVEITRAGHGLASGV